MTKTVTQGLMADYGSAASPARRPASRRARITRGVLSFLFIFSTLAAGHLLMVVINALDRYMSPGAYQIAGTEAKWFGDRSRTDELGHLEDKFAHGGHLQTVQEALRTIENGEVWRFHMFPVSRFLIGVMFALIGLGLVLLLVSRWVKSDAIQSILGVFAALFLWTGAAEYGLMIASRVLGVAKSFQVHDGRIIGAYGEYVLLKHTWGVLLLVIVYLLFQESNRCPFFLWFRRRLPLMRGAVATGRIDNFAPRTAFQYMTVMWTFYVLLLWAYDPTVFGVDSWFTHAVFFASFAGTGYLVLRLCRQRTTGHAVRYAIATAIVCWNDVEIMAKWHLFQEPWLVLHPMNATVFFGGMALGTWLVIRELQHDRAPRASAVMLAESLGSAG